MIGPESVISILAVTLLGTGALLSRLPIGTCRECPHCRLEKVARERERTPDVSPAYSAPYCALCGRRHRVDEDHPF
jgi:hypothetical protein